MSFDWTVRWKWLVFAGYGVLFALIVNKFIDGPGWSKFLVMVVMAGIMGAIGHRIGKKQMRDSV